MRLLAGGDSCELPSVSAVKGTYGRLTTTSISGPSATNDASGC